MITSLLRSVFVAIPILGFANARAAAAPGSVALRYSLFDPATNVQVQAEQGHSVAVDGNFAIVGAPKDDAAGLDSGAVKVYDARTGALLHTLVKPNPGESDHFGAAVAISGTLVVVGAPDDNATRFQAGNVYVFDLSSVAPTVPLLTLINPSPAEYEHFGAAVAISGTRIVVGAYGTPWGGINSGTAHAYDLQSAEPAMPLFELLNPAPSTLGYFGASVALSDGLALVGAPQHDAGSTDAGVVYIYDLDSFTPSFTAGTLLNPSPADFDYFGRAVAISGTRVVVGAPNDDTGGANAGIAYLYDLSRSTPNIPALTFTNPSPASMDQFGTSVAISGTRILISGWWDEPGMVNVGRSYIYDLNALAPRAPVFTLTNPAPAQFDYFGWAASISGTRVLIGTPVDDTTSTNGGIAYAYDLNSATPSLPVSTLDHNSLAGFHHFGDAVAISGTRLVVGAGHAPFNDPFNDKESSFGGNAYVYDLAGVTPQTPLVLTNPTPSAYDGFGRSVAMNDSIVAIGAPNDSSTGYQYGGIVYLYALTSAIPGGLFMTLTNPIPGYGERFGFDIALSGTRLAVAAPYATGGSIIGRAFVFDLAGANPHVPVATLNNPLPTNGDNFGNSIAMDGARVVVGAYGEDAGGSDAGIAYVFDLTSATPGVPTLTLTNPTPVSNDLFGFGVAISGTYVAIDSPNDGSGKTSYGTVYIYDLASATPTQPVLQLNNPSSVWSSWFGVPLAMAGTRVVVGAEFDDIGATNAGRVFIYDLNSIQPSEPIATLTKPFPAYNDYFGHAVAAEGTTVVVGTPYEDSNGPDRGAAYVFTVGPTLRVVPSPPGFVTLSRTPTDSPGFVLQYADSLAPTNWINAPGGATNPVIISLTNAARFYRLVQP